MREATIVGHIQRYAKAHGAWVLKVHGDPYQLSGVPDLLLCCRGRFVALEVKVPGSDATPLQAYELKCIRETGGVSAVVHSLDEARTVLDPLLNNTWQTVGGFEWMHTVGHGNLEDD